jgi:hypothetical protein
MSKHVVAGYPDDVAGLVSGLHGCIQMVAVVVGKQVLPVAVPGFDKQRASGEHGTGFGAVLGDHLLDASTDIRELRRVVHRVVAVLGNFAARLAFLGLVARIIVDVDSCVVATAALQQAVVGIVASGATDL